MNSSPLIGEDPQETSFRKISLYGVAVFWIVGIITLVMLAIFLKPESKDLNKLNMIFVNDVHIDPLYKETGIFDLSMKEVCRTAKENVTASKFGKYGCDPPVETFISMTEHLKDAEPNPAFIAYGGDSLGHNITSSITDICNNLTGILHNLTRSYKNVSLLFTIGNNDLAPNYGSWATDEEQFLQLSTVMKKYITEEQLKTFKKGAYYAHDVPSQKLRILVLNTVIYSPSALRKVYDPERKDPYGQFEWIKEQVAAANKKGEKIGLLMHIPPAIAHTDLKPGFHREYAHAFYDAIKSANVSFILVSHTHKDQIIPLHDGTPFYHTLSAVSISPSHYNNPGFRVYELVDGKIENYRQYFADIRPNPKELKWELEYDFNTLYGQNGVNQQTISNVVNKIQTTSRYLWLYREMLFANADVHNSFYICALNSVTAEDLQNCTRGVNNIDRLYP